MTWWTLFSLDSVVFPVGLKVNLDLFGGFSWLILIWTWLPSTMKLTFSHLKMDGWKTFAFPFGKAGLFSGATVDGRNPAPVDMVIIPSYTGSYTSQVVSRISSINSMLVSGRGDTGIPLKDNSQADGSQHWGYCSLGWCLRRWWRGGTRMVGVVMSQCQGRVKKGRIRIQSLGWDVWNWWQWYGMVLWSGERQFMLRVYSLNPMIYAEKELSLAGFQPAVWYVASQCLVQIRTKFRGSLSLPWN